jgi:ATP-dependent exoDNAse (exonuclease V) beta subunit
MEAKYSVLISNHDLSEYENQINIWLHEGIKVIWFGSISDVKILKEKYSDFVDAYILKVFVTNFSYTGIIIDGKDEANLLPIINKECPLFNTAQYEVEHCLPHENIIVQASAGTGKTTVMIDRIMFLMHTVPGLRMSEIYMITFTNDATNQMNLRLQEMLMLRFRLTGQLRYFQWIEEQSQMNISTIHSFAFAMLKQFGIFRGFTKNLSIRSFKYEKDELIKDMIDEKTHANTSVREQVGIKFHEANKLIEKYWLSFERLGVSHNDMLEMEWGKPSCSNSFSFHELIASAFNNLDERYLEIKQQNDAVSLNDVMRDLQEVLMGRSLPKVDISMKYLFIDEFQDADFSQINVATILSKLLDATLFVVGDVKQSIYRFRGATDSSFEVLKKELHSVGLKAAKEFILVHNYRTASNIMKRMDTYFEAWGRRGYLRYDKTVTPLNRKEGTIRMLAGASSQGEVNAMIVRQAQTQLERLVGEVELLQKETGKKPTEKNRVVMLTRTNTELNKLSALLRENEILNSIKRDGSFYTSEAVRDFYALICSYMFADEPKHVFNYLLTPYAGEIEPLDVNLMENMNANPESLFHYIGRHLKGTRWGKYYKDLRLYPIMSVIKNIYDAEPIVENYISNHKKNNEEQGWDEKRNVAETKAKAIQYQANLEKLIEILQSNLSVDKVSLYDVYNFLKLKIATDREESEPNVETDDDYRTILCMTVHKSKGLEFDTVIIPYTDCWFRINYDTELLINPSTKEVGWNYSIDKGTVTSNNSYPKNTDSSSVMSNDLYPKLKDREIQQVREEETRILYVAMTRAINHLICIVKPSKGQERWSYLIEEIGVDYE